MEEKIIFREAKGKDQGPFPGGFPKEKFKLVNGKPRATPLIGKE